MRAFVKKDYSRILIGILLLSGMVLSLVQFIFNRSFVLDEASLALNVLHRDFSELLKPLDYIQVAPFFFLFLTKWVTLMITEYEFGFRIIPLLSYWFALYFFYRLIKKFFPNHFLQIFALSLFVFNATLFDYSGVFKQYMTDVFVSVLILYLVINYSRFRYNYLFLGLVGAFCIFLSNIAVVILCSAWLYLLFLHLVRKEFGITHILSIALIWVAAFILYYYFSIKDHPLKTSMNAYWLAADGFCPANPFRMEFYNFIWEKTKMIFGSLLSSGFIGMYLLPVLILMGVAHLMVTKQSGLLLLLLLPVIIHFILSSLRLYPFDNRLILYTIPHLLIISLFGLSFFIERINIISSALVFKLFILGASFYVCGEFFRHGFPFEHEEIKKSIKYVENHLQDHDKIYVYYGAKRQFDYYKEIEFMDLKDSILYGSSGNRKNRSRYIEEIEKLEGNTWILFSHVYLDEERYILNKIDSLGYNKLKSHTATGSSAYLYNLSD